MPGTDKSPRLTVHEYEERALLADQLGEMTLAVPLLGPFGETGSLLSEAKKKHRDAVSYTGYETTVIEELGDVLWYLTAVAHHGGLSLSELAHRWTRNPLQSPQTCYPSSRSSIQRPRGRCSPTSWCSFRPTAIPPKSARTVPAKLTIVSASYPIGEPGWATFRAAISSATGSPTAAAWFPAPAPRCRFEVLLTRPTEPMHIFDFMHAPKGRVR